jgi:hypothetical protein
MTIRQDYPREKDRAIKRDGNWSWIAVVIVAVAIVAGFAAYEMGDWKNPAVQSGTTITPATTTNGANSIPDRVAPANTQNQTSPQGPTGPLNTGTGGAPAANPRGETPPGMQSGPGAPESQAPTK